MTNDEYLLSSGDYTASVAPACGGALLSWKEKNQDLLRPALENAVLNHAADETAMFPLVPYSNRIRGGSFIYWGIRRSVPKNHLVVEDPLHGEGWQKQWQVKENNQNTLTLFFEHNGKTAFPFSYEVEQTYTLNENQLIVSMTIKNKGGIPMPCGLGWHPYFLKDEDTVVSFKSKTLWAHELAPPRERPIKTPPEWQFEKGLSLQGLELDTCFGGFDGKAEITYPSRKKKIEIKAQSDFGHIVVWSSDDKDFFCLEPVTNTNDAFNLASRGITGTGIKTLEPEETLTETMTLTVSSF